MNWIVDLRNSRRLLRALLPWIKSGRGSMGLVLPTRWSLAGLILKPLGLSTLAQTSAAFARVSLPQASYALLCYWRIAGQLGLLQALTLAYERLDAQGLLVIWDAFDLQPLRESSSSERWPLGYLERLAQRAGFQIESIGLLGYGFPDRRMGQGLLVLRKRVELHWRVATQSQLSTDDLIRLFERSFEGAMNPELWRWKYQERGRYSAVVWEGQDLIGHYGGISRTLSYFGKMAPGVQIADVMIARDKRGYLNRQGPFFQMTAAFPESACGYGLPHLVGYGFPTGRHMKLAELQGFYREVARIQEWSWPPTPEDARLPGALFLFEPTSPMHWIWLEQAWQRMQHELRDAILGVRNADWIRYRYLGHPVHRYALWWYRQGVAQRAPDQLLVMRRQDERCEWLDVIGSVTPLEPVVQGARALCRQLGGERLVTWMTDAYANRFAATGGQMQPTEITVPTSVWTAGPPPEQLRGCWWLMPGDTDFR